MHVQVNARVVAAPWELGERIRRRIWVGREVEVQPEPGPVELYQARWPHRVIRWNVPLQLFEITSTDPADNYLEHVFFWDTPPDPDQDRTPEEIAKLVDQGAAAEVVPVRRWAPFDYAFVERRLKEAAEWDGLGANPARKLARRVADHNANVTQRKKRAVRVMWDEWAADERRFLPELAARHAGRTPAEARTERIPLVPVGASLT